MSRAVVALGILTLLTLPTFADDLPDLIPNSIKYSDTGLKPASGRSGDVAVEARALLGADGVTDVELTTGSFEGNVAPTGSLKQVQVKAAYETDDAITRNFSTSGTFAAVRLDDLGLAPRENIQIQASAESIAYGRTGVVTLVETVKRRPDLIATTGSVPRYGIEGHPLHFYMNIIEGNGDVGARADCVLRVDGAEVDRATGIWVDARGSVSCAMTHLFTTTGAHQVQMSVENVSPGDWNGGNNATPAVTVTIRSTSDVVAGGSYVASARETLHEVTSESRMDESQPAWENEDTRITELSNSTRLDAFIPAEYDFDTMFVSVSEESDGQNLSSASGGGAARGEGSNCAMLRFSRTFTFTGCVYDGVTTIAFARGSGRSTYYSKFWGMFTNNWTGETHTYEHEMNMNRPFGGNRFYGETVSMQLIATDKDHAWEADPYMTMVPWSDPEQTSSGCVERLGSQACWTRTERTSGRNGDDTR